MFQHTNGQMKRPYIICHMTQSIDGKVTGGFLEAQESAGAVEVYYEINRAYKADAFACGRVTMEGSFTGGYYPELAKYEGAEVPDGDFIGPYKNKFFAVSFDRKGRLGWKSGEIEDEDPGYGGAHIIEVMCEGADVRYLAYLREIGVSYIFAGKEEMDLPTALEKLYTLFGIERLLLEGGSIINGAFLRAGAVDELSLVVAPVVAAAGDKPLFMGSELASFELMGAKKHENGALWLNYTRKRSEREKILEFAAALPSSVLDMPFEDDFETTVFRHGEGGKWFGLLMRVEKSRVGIAGEGKADVLNLKCDPEESFIVREMYEGIIPAYHMNKRHWISVILESGVPLDFAQRLIEKSYDLTEKKRKTSAK